MGLPYTINIRSIGVVDWGVFWGGSPMAVPDRSCLGVLCLVGPVPWTFGAAAGGHRQQGSPPVPQQRNASPALATGGPFHPKNRCRWPALCMERGDRRRRVRVLGVAWDSPFKVQLGWEWHGVAKVRRFARNWMCGVPLRLRPGVRPSQAMWIMTFGRLKPCALFRGQCGDIHPWCRGKEKVKRGVGMVCPE